MSCCRRASFTIIILYSIRVQYKYIVVRNHDHEVQWSHVQLLKQAYYQEKSTHFYNLQLQWRTYVQSYNTKKWESFPRRSSFVQYSKMVRARQPTQHERRVWGSTMQFIILAVIMFAVSSSVSNMIEVWWGMMDRLDWQISPIVESHSRAVPRGSMNWQWKPTTNHHGMDIDASNQLRQRTQGTPGTYINQHVAAAHWPDRIQSLWTLVACHCVSIRLRKYQTGVQPDIPWSRMLAMVPYCFVGLDCLSIWMAMIPEAVAVLEEDLKHIRWWGFHGTKQTADIAWR
jgi:hypothetical protein